MNDPLPSTPNATPSATQPVQPEGTQSPTTILLFGILGFFFAPLGGIAWWYGKQYITACADENLAPDQSAVVGMYLGMISFLIFCAFVGVSLVMLLLWLVLFVVFMGLNLLFVLLMMLASL
jgi:hypothetical protein